MKNILLFIFSLVYVSTNAQDTTAPDSLGLPGDNLNLYAVMDLFEKSETFEVFEKKLNNEETRINNLDLNNDGKIDYIRVIDHQEGDNHAIVLQVPINEKENQDVAVIELEKDKDNSYRLQIIGDEALYGKDYIIEPLSEAEEKKAAPQNTMVTVEYVPLPQWQMVRYVYRPAYVVYVSPWGWAYYPTYWKPWAPRYYRYYYHYHARFHYPRYYHRTTVYRTTIIHSYYKPRQSHSVMVQQYQRNGSYTRPSQPASHSRRSSNANPGYRGRKSSSANTNQNNFSQGRQRSSGNKELKHDPAAMPNRHERSTNGNGGSPRSGGGKRGRR